LKNRSSLKSIKEFVVSDKSKFIPYITFFILMVISSWILPSESISGDSERTFNYNISNLIFNIKYHAIAPAGFFPYFDVKFNAFGLGYDKIHLVLYTAIFLFVVYGIVKNIKDDYLYVIYFLLNLTVFIIITGRDQRFFMPLFPFFMYFLFLGLSNISVSYTLSDKYNFAPINAVYLVGTGLLVISLLSVSHTTYKNIIFNKTEVIEGPYSPDSIELFNYINEHTKKDDSIIFHKPRAMVLYTDRKSFAMGNQNFTPDKAFNSDAKYIAINKTKYLSYDLTLQDFQGKLDCEFENKSFLLCDLKKNLNR